MVDRDVKATDPAAHQPTKADIGIDAAPEALAWAVTRGGAERQEDPAASLTLNDRWLRVESDAMPYDVHPEADGSTIGPDF